MVFMTDSSCPAQPPYCGRFAPSPSGPLHLGSLVTALGSWLDARAHQGTWRLRIEDIDPPSAVKGAVDDQLKALEHFGLFWDGALCWQSERSDAYEDALRTLRSRLFWCTCRRAQLQAMAPNYAGTCHTQHSPPPHETAAIRLRGKPEAGFADRDQGWCRVTDAGEDPVLKRRDGLWAYTLAVVVDDAAQGITDIVRGADLISTTPVQIMLQQALGLPTPRYLHLPLITAADGRKLSKQNHAEGLDLSQRPRLLRMAMAALGLSPPTEVDASELLAWGVEHWHQRNRMPLQQSLQSLTPQVAHS